MQNHVLGKRPVELSGGAKIIPLKCYANLSWKKKSCYTYI